MLLQLNITNFALIEKLSISFEGGFNVFSGETGAGKSILIDSINYVLGEKFSKDFIRTGEEKTFVEAIFSIENEKTQQVLKELEVEYEDILIISRETFQSGKSIAKVNGKAFILANIKFLAQTLLDIHGQHENQSLLDSSNHISYLDYFGQNKIINLIKEFTVNYNKLSQVDLKIKNLQGNEGEKEKLSDFFKYQMDEINKSNLKIGEEIELEQKFSILSNAEKIEKTMATCYEILYSGQEDRSSIFDQIGTLVKEVRNVEKHMDSIKNIANSLEETYYAIEQNIEEIRKVESSIYYDDKELEYVNSRIYQIGTLKKKYGNSIEAILKYKENLELQYDEIIHSEEVIKDLKKEREALFQKMKKQVFMIHEVRKEMAEELEQKVKTELAYIGLQKSTFKIKVELNEDQFNELGGDKVQFYISTNPGEPLKPLEKVVSGGELSRIMLALKTVFVDKDKIPSVIFDEIDTGISGRIAQSVAEKLYLISNKHQVFCVTHLPQIACISDFHYIITKETLEEKTYTFVSKLSEEEKNREIARMIGSAEVTQLTLEHAKELIEMAESKKIELLS